MMKSISFAALALIASSYASATESLISIESSYPAKETADRFESIIKDKGLTLFARINHQKNASGVDLDLRATEVIIFGNPKVGTPLMQCEQQVAIDLPQKVLISEDANNKVWLSYNNPEYLKERHHIKGCDKVINKISMVLNKLGTAATSK
ncbi:DUF302 domain-containing protein [Motiliproteus sp. MSK22-1]|uniref:DUF302 domain-containing protein n=1 Tax=Motiliproteus sp. MSK22-1 TaxID=1897630 RepID=UPI0009754B4F|nr:DUF302 domain-containing protein [Motiliproteus sp. MSK22-1]OMH33830.1 hypothetical protein BGP75_12645 [Motiliproteus sp. MSK22-1]